ncbi:hypothetical protein LguiA_022103 [Lonicera macranthoides]
MTKNNPMTASERERKSKKHWNSDILLTQNDPQNEDNISHSVARENPQIEGPSGSDKGPSGEPIDKSVLTSFNDHIAYGIWNMESDQGVSEVDVIEETKDTYAVRMQWLKEKCMGRTIVESTSEELDRMGYADTCTPIHQLGQASRSGQVEVDKVISMLYEAFYGDEVEDISIVACNAYDILLKARKATAPEKAQEYDPNATLSSTIRPLAKGKGNTSETKRRKN